MELKVNEVIIPERIDFNYEELKRELTERVQKYETLVYTDEQIKEAKADRATLNKLKRALNDERIRREREYMAPFEEFKKKVNEIISIIDKPVAMIDKQVKEYEEKKKADKRVQIGEYWMGIEHPDWMTLPQIFDERWLNAGYSMRQIQDDITGWINRVNTEVATLSRMPEFSFEAIDVYKRTLDVNKAITEGERLADIQKRKAQEEMHKADEELTNSSMGEWMNKPEPEAPKDAEEVKEETGEGQWISFSAKLTIPQALELREFFVSRNIEFKKV